VNNDALQNEMKITVIATGFEHVADVQPLIARNGNAAAAVSKAPVTTGNLPSSAASSTSGDLDVPTFIRRKAD
jgi:hypothetical protein